MADKEQVDSVSSTSQASNPLTRKLNKILETRLDNDKVYLCSTSTFKHTTNELMDKSCGQNTGTCFIRKQTLACGSEIR